jgi:hypothetical protein
VAKESEPQEQADVLLDPPKLLRIASLAREILEELRRSGAEEGAEAPAEIYARVVKELRTALPRDLYAELDSIDLDLALTESATKEEVRVAYSGLIGWLSGLFQGLQAVTAQAVLAQAAQAAVSPPRDETPAVAEGEKPPPDKEGYL